MTLSSVLSLGLSSQSYLIWITLSLIVLLIVRSIYRISPLHPLSDIPGPLLPRLTSLYLTYQAFIGTECTTVHAFHRKYGPILRTGPNSVDIADGAALVHIYSTSGSFRKPSFYGNFDIDGHKSIFSETDPKTRAVRAKAVTPLFASAGLRAGEEVLEKAVGEFVRRTRAVRKGEVVNLLNLTRGLAVDVVTSYLFGRAYKAWGSASGENRDNKVVGGPARVEMTANGMVDLFVAVGRFWYLPNWAFKWADWYDARFGEGSSPKVGESLKLVDEYITDVVKDAVAALETKKSVGGVGTTSYPARLLTAGISESETRAQCKDLIFAGTDSTGMNLATIMFYLAKHPEVYSKLKAEVCSERCKDISDPLEIQSLPYLRGVVREGLRLSMANPSRLPRVVPDAGWTFGGYNFPAGTVVSCTPYELHLNPEVFPQPEAFKPERWIDSNAQELDLMNRDAIPFGQGSRQCIARNLATAELYLATKALVVHDCLAGASYVNEKIEIMEWFNSHVIGGKIELVWK